MTIKTARKRLGVIRSSGVECCVGRRRRETRTKRHGFCFWVGLVRSNWSCLGFVFGLLGGGSAKEMDRRAARLSEEGAQKLAVCFHINKSPEQEAESQQIVGQSLLSCLQYPVPYLSRLQRIYPSQHSKLRWSMMLGRSLS